MIFEKVKELLAEQLGIDIEDIQEDSKLVDDLGADGLDCIEIMMMVEMEFDIEITDSKAENIHTVADLVLAIKEVVEING